MGIQWRQTRPVSQPIKGAEAVDLRIRKSHGFHGVECEKHAGLMECGKEWKEGIIKEREMYTQKRTNDGKYSVERKRKRQ